MNVNKGKSEEMSLMKEKKIRKYLTVSLSGQPVAIFFAEFAEYEKRTRGG